MHCLKRMYLPSLHLPRCLQTSLLIKLILWGLDHPNGVNLSCEYVCGPACLYNCLGILVLFCIRKTDFLVVLWEWDVGMGGLGLLQVHFLPEEDAFAGVSALWRKVLLLDFLCWVGLELWLLFSPKKSSKLKLNFVS